MIAGLDCGITRPGIIDVYLSRQFSGKKNSVFGFDDGMLSMLFIVGRLRVCDTPVYHIHAGSTASNFLCALLFHERRNQSRAVAVDQRGVSEQVSYCFLGD